MDKVFQILIVFGLVILLIQRFIKGKVAQYIPYDFIIRLRPPLSAEVEGRMIAAERVDVEGVIGDKADEERVVGDETDVVGFEMVRDDLLFYYRATGSLTIYRRSRQGRNKELQEIAVPVDCSTMAMDPLENRLYFEAGGYWFVYGMV
jgi:hypothetical protein